MNIKQTVSGSRMELALEGKLDAVTAPKFEAEITEHLDKHTELDIDLSAVEYISSAGLSRSVVSAADAGGEKRHVDRPQCSRGHHACF